MRLYWVGLAVMGLGMLGATMPGPATTGPATMQAPTVKGKVGAPLALFNGKDLAGWSWHSGTVESRIGDVWTVKDGVLHCATRPTGFIDTEKEYKNFVLTIEYRHLTNANGGVFVCIKGEEKVWPDAVQVQGKFGAVGELINQNTGMKKMVTEPGRTRTVNRDVVVSRMVTEVEKPLKEWNTLVITMENGSLNVALNGKWMNSASELAPDSGKIGIQAEGAEMEFRKVELVPIE